jgi:fatty acid amide hydrolase
MDTMSVDDSDLSENATASIIDLSATELARRIKNGELTSVEATEAFIERIRAVNESLNAVVIPLFDEALAHAAAADQARQMGDRLGPLHGVPITIKEQYIVAGTQTTIGLPSEVGKIRHNEGPLVGKLRKAGAVILGKTNNPQLLIAHESDNPVYGRTNNPWDLTRTCGGSSGGEGAIIAARGSPLGLGGDYGGSIRIPSTFCGITGIKPTSWRLSNADGPADLFTTGQEAIVPQPGPMARTVDDLILAMEVLAALNERETPDLVPPVPWPDPSLVNISKLRIGMFTYNGYFRVSPALKRAVEEVSKGLVARGIDVVPFEMPDVTEAMRIYLGIASADGGVKFLKLLGRNKPHPLAKGLIQAATAPKILKPIIFKMMRSRGQRYLPELGGSMGGISTSEFWDLVDRRTAYRQKFIDAMDRSKLDALICPPNGTVAPLHGKTSDMILPCSTYVMPINVLGTPAGVVPVTRVKDGEESDRKPTKDLGDLTAIEIEKGSKGMPVSVQVIGRHWREDVVLAVMKAIEDDFKDRPDYPILPPELT